MGEHVRIARRVVSLCAAGLVAIATMLASAPAAAANAQPPGAGDHRQGLSGVDPVRGGLDDVVAVAAGYHHSLALRADGTVWAWGWGWHGQLGDGTRLTRRTPVQVSGLTDVTEISAGYGFSLAVRADGTLWAWGNNEYAALGLGHRDLQLVPGKVALSGVVDVAGGDDHTVAVRSDGDAWAWGDNEYRQLGHGSLALRREPVRVRSLGDVAAIDGGEYFAVALDGDGTVWSWGYDWRSDDARKRPHAIRRPAVVSFLSAGEPHAADAPRHDRQGVGVELLRTAR